eukprot:CAMPEP_0183291276 /NCGR_PEP_ID=MMETSP0160_2-20130417/749_1 /TAXON_ID=2839 ORGANISM="Odontella Sinensis, Strain Grunow 1884" /NCGR_SAMPLE_ID=MMETSP0160_2 /ASSEMBLY_ACC=CAM_ASM_000250 /LENGTH=431 /DNA_ID=CAMNT_0025452061 /DNA_START=98 /DNA_END=1393 /DNA_ORIENTATION=+
MIFSLPLLINALSLGSAHKHPGNVRGRKLGKSSLPKIKPSVQAQIDEFRHTLWGEAIDRTLHPASDAASCFNPIEEFLGQLLGGMSDDDLNLISAYGIDQIPMVYSLFVDWHDHDEYFGTFGEETQEILSAQDALEEFWSKPTAFDGGFRTDNILLVGMHGADMKDLGKLIPTLEVMYDLNGTNYTHTELATEIQAIIQTMPYEYDNPIFTFNAFAYPAGEEGDKIVMGDGIIEYLHYRNAGMEGPEFILGHEFGHHMQFEIDLPPLGGLPESLETRRYELMADALSAYFLAHEAGAHMRDHRILELQHAAFSVGDCNGMDPGHHGTPRQRGCAVAWGIGRAANATGADDVMHPADFGALFDQNLDKIMGLDESVCSHSFGSVPGGPRNTPGQTNSTTDTNDSTTKVSVTTVTTTTREETVTTTRTETVSD